MEHMEVRHEEGDRFRIAIREHEVVVDQPLHDGGSDAGPTPTELFVAGLASCVGYYAGSFCRRHEIDATGLAVACDWEFAQDRPARVADIRIRVTLPRGFPAGKLDRFQAVIEHCTVHNSLEHPPAVTMTTEAPAAV